MSHGNAARLSGYHGAPSLARLLAAIASDEARHEEAFAAAVAQIFQKDPEGAASALGDLARRGLVMPGARMDDGWHEVANAVGGTRSSGSVRVGSSGSSNGGGSSSSDRVRGGGEGGGDGGRGGSNGASQLYRDYAAAADALGVFTVADYAAGLEQLLEIWNVRGRGWGGEGGVKCGGRGLRVVPGVRGLSGVGAKGPRVVSGVAGRGRGRCCR